MGEIAEAFRRIREKESARSARPSEVDDSSPGQEPRAEDSSSESLPRQGERPAELGPPPRPPAAPSGGPPSKELRLRDVRPTAQAPLTDSPASPPTAPQPKPSPARVVSLKPTVPAVGVALSDPGSPSSTANRQLAQRVKAQINRRGLTSIVITSPLSGDGKTTTTCNLAIAMCELDRSRAIVLVELDLRRPTLAKVLGFKVEVGVEDLLAERVSLDEALIECDVPGLYILAVRRATSSPEELLASDRLRRLFESLRRRFWVALIDTPPALAVSDAASVFDVADAGLLVVRAGRSPARSVPDALAQLPADKVLGCCLNFAPTTAASGGYYYRYEPVESRSGEAAEPGDEAESSAASHGSDPA